MIQDLANDLRHGARLLRRSPGFAVIATLSLAIGIGANTAIFQLLDAVRLRALPVNRPQELASIRVASPDFNPTVFLGQYQDLTNPLWERIRDQEQDQDHAQDRQQAFSRLAAVGGNTVNLAQSGEARYAQGIWVSGDFFNVLEVQPALGRLLTRADDTPGCGSPGAVISYAFWQREFGGDPTILGKTLTVNDRPFGIVGVTAAGFFGVEVGRPFDVAVPICAHIGRGANPITARDLYWLAAIGRLKRGWTLERASAHLAAISPELFKQTAPSGYAAGTVQKYLDLRLGAFSIESGFSKLRDRYEQPLWVLLAIAGVVLLIACSNLASLMLARAGAREREIAIRLALGASRGRLIRQLLAESLLLALGGAVCGWFLGRGLTRFLISLLNSFGARAAIYSLDLRTDWRMLAFTAGVAIFTCVVFGLAPAVRGTSVAPAAALAGGRANTPGRERFGLRRALVVAQVALSLVLMVSAALFSRSLGNLLNLNAGFKQEGLLYATLDYIRLKLPMEQRHAYKRKMLERVRQIPGVTAAADTTLLPVGGNFWRLGVVADSADAGGPVKKSMFNWVSPGFFETMEMTLLAGRDFDSRDSELAPRVAVVNEAFVQKIFSGGSPIGKTFVTVAEPGYPTTIFTIVGVVKNAKYRDLREEFLPVVFAPEAQHPSPTTFQVVMIRAASPASLIPAIKEMAGEVNPSIGLDFDLLRNVVLRQLLRERLMASLSIFFGLLATILATVGLYGVVSYIVIRRTREIGIRMAIGARPLAIIKLILWETAVLAGIGIGIGMVLAWFAVRAADALLYGMGSRDPRRFFAAALLLGIAALLAGYLPARRAARLDPMIALREE